MSIADWLVNSASDLWQVSNLQVLSQTCQVLMRVIEDLSQTFEIYIKPSDTLWIIKQDMSDTLWIIKRYMSDAHNYLSNIWAIIITS